MKKLPPFGKQLKAKIQSDWRPPNGINIYTSWKMGRPWPHCITFPPDSDPSEYNWTFLVGQEITITNTERYAEYNTLKNLAVLLVQSGARSVALNDGDHLLQYFVPEVKEDAA